MAGVDSTNTSLYVHGTVHSVCDAGYCLNDGSCSVVTVAPGELQPSCQCHHGFAGLRYADDTTTVLKTRLLQV